MNTSEAMSLVEYYLSEAGYDKKRRDQWWFHPNQYIYNKKPIKLIGTDPDSVIRAALLIE